MDSADFDLSGIDIPQSIHEQGFGSVREKKGKVLVRFEWRPILNKYRLEKEGVPTFENRLFAERRLPGYKDQPGDIEVKFITKPNGTRVPDPTNKIVRDHPQELKRFLEFGEKPVEGMPIEQWTGASREFVAICNFLEIRTLEELVSQKDNEAVVSKLGLNGKSMVARAQAFLDSRNDERAAEKLAAEKEALRRELEIRDQRMADLEAKLAELSSGKVKKNG